LVGTNLHEAKMTRATISRLAMRDVDLSGADLTDAKMSVSLMERVNLSGADLRGSSMNIVYITDADLRGANLQKIRCDQFTLPYLVLQFQINIPILRHPYQQQSLLPFYPFCTSI
jgi:uncharacterized protein YjbI with pentapeptide repeats